MQVSRQEYETDQFMQELRQQSTQRQLESTQSNQIPRQNTRLNNHNSQFPHYWPADKVPYIEITYCQCIQYVFAAMFFIVLIWIFVGLKHFGETNQSNSIVNKQQNPLPNNQKTQQNGFLDMKMEKNQYTIEDSGIVVKELIQNEDKNIILNRVFDHNLYPNPNSNRFTPDPKPKFQFPHSDHQEA